MFNVCSCHGLADRCHAVAVQVEEEVRYVSLSSKRWHSFCSRPSDTTDRALRISEQFDATVQAHPSVRLLYLYFLHLAAAGPLLPLAVRGGGAQPPAAGACRPPPHEVAPAARMAPAAARQTRLTGEGAAAGVRVAAQSACPGPAEGAHPPLQIANRLPSSPTPAARGGPCRLPVLR